VVIGKRKNKQDLIEVFKICKGFYRIRPNDLFFFDDSGKGTRGYSLKLHCVSKKFSPSNSL